MGLLKDVLVGDSKEYRKDILFPVMQFISRQRGQPELYEGLISDLDPLAMPRGTSEMEVKMRQVSVCVCVENFQLIVASLCVVACLVLDKTEKYRKLFTRT